MNRRFSTKAAFFLLGGGEGGVLCVTSAPVMGAVHMNTKHHYLEME